MRRGVALIELLVATALLGIIAVAVTNAYLGSLVADQRIRDSRSWDTEHRLLQDRITTILQRAYVTTDSDDTATCFIGDTGSGGTSNSGTVSGNYADTLTFTSFGDRVPTSVIVSSDDFETQNRTHGPLGGLEEVCISMNPVGQPQETGGLYLREQRPADGDHTQGGYETHLDLNVTQIQFEFWDGSEWATTWDTTTMGTKRIPAAVRITYKLSGDEDTTIFVVNLPHSDVTSTDPVTESTT